MPSAANWLGLAELPLTEAKLESIGFADCHDLLLALVDSPAAVEAAQYALQGERAEQPGIIDWLKDLSTELIAAYSATPAKTHRARLYATLEGIYGASTRSYHNGSSIVHKLNPIHFAACFAFSLRIEYDDKIGCFFRYETATGKWGDVSETEIREKLTMFSVPFINEAPTLYAGTDRFFKEILSHVKAIARHRPLHLPDRQLLLANNCTMVIDRASGNIATSAHSPAYKLRNRIAIDYDKTQTGCTAFRKFLGSIMPADAIEVLQWWCGLVLLGRNDLHKILLLRGAAGSGKSTLINLIEAIIGEDNTATLVTDRLEERFELSEFFGKTLLIGRDVSTHALTNRSAYMLKALSGDSGIKAEVKNQQKRIRLGGPFNICLVSNARLSVSLQSDADAWRRRLWVINVTYPTKEFVPVPNYEQVMLKNEGTAIFKWMLDGTKAILTARRLKRTLTPSASQLALIDELLTGEDSLMHFTRHAVQAASGNHITTEDLYLAYDNHCLANRMDAVRQTVFNRGIGKALVKFHKVTHRNITTPSGKLQKGYTDIGI